MAGTNEFAFFRCKSICTGGGGPESGRKKIEKCLPAGTGTKIYFSSDLYDDVELYTGQRLSKDCRETPIHEILAKQSRRRQHEHGGKLTSIQWAFRPTGLHPQYGWDFPEEIRKNSGKTPETLSERFLEFPSRVRLECPKPHNSRHLRLPERFQNSLPPSTAGDASFFRIGSGEGLSELLMEFPAVLGVFLTHIPMWPHSCGFATHRDMVFLP